MEFFFADNIVTAVLTLAGVLLIWLITPKARGRVSEEPEADRWPMASRLISLVLSLLLVAISAYCIYENYGSRDISRKREAAFTAIAAAVDAASMRAFDKRCAFNGQMVGADWIATDSFPCENFAGIRLWRASKTLVSKNAVGSDTSVFIGRSSGPDVILLATYRPTDSYNGIDGPVPSIKTSEQNEGLARITSEIRTSLANSP